MIAKALQNPKLRTKFKVGNRVKLLRSVWTKLTDKMVNLPSVEYVVTRVGDSIILTPGKKRRCRFSITLGAGTTDLFTGQIIWEEWMLEKIEVLRVPPPLHIGWDMFLKSEPKT